MAAGPRMGEDENEDENEDGREGDAGPGAGGFPAGANSWRGPPLPARPAFEDEGVEAGRGPGAELSAARSDRRTAPEPHATPQAFGTPLDRVLIAVIVSGLALPLESANSDGQIRHPRRRIHLVATSDS